MLSLIILLDVFFISKILNNNLFLTEFYIH